MRIKLEAHDHNGTGSVSQTIQLQPHLEDGEFLIAEELVLEERLS